MRLPRSVVVLLLLALPAAMPERARGTQEPDLLPLPSPNLESTEAAVRQAVLDATRGVQEALGVAGVEEQARRWGRLGQVYHVHAFRSEAEVCYRNAALLNPQEVRWVHLLGLLSFEKGDLAGAVESFERAVELQPDGVSSWLRLAEASLRQGAVGRARTAFGRALDLDPRSAAAHCGLGRIARQEGRLEVARERFEACLSLQPDATRVHAILAGLYRKLGDEAAARRHAERYGPTEVSFSDPYVVELQSAAAQSDQHLARGAELSRSGRNELALEAYREALEAHPEDPRVHQALGTVYERLGRLEDSLEHFRRAVELAPDDTLSHFNLASLYARLERYQEAGRELREVLRLDPGDREAISTLAWIERRLGDAEEAVRLYGRLLELDPSDRQALVARAQIFSDMGRTDEAVADLEAAAALRPGDAAVLLRLGSLRVRLGELEAASAALAEAIAESPDAASKARAHYTLAVVRLQQRRDADALVELEAAATAAPGEQAPKSLLATLLASSGDEKVRDGGRALRLARDLFVADSTPAHAEIVAMAYAAVGDFAEAVAWQERLLEELGASAEAAWSARLRSNLERYRARKMALPPGAEGSG